MKEYICDCNIIHEDVVKRALNNKPSDEIINNLSSVFKLIGDTTRLKILMLLDEEQMCVCDIANVLNMTKSSISHQLATLRNAGLVKSRKSGKEVYYTLDDNHVKKLYELGIEHINHKLKEGINEEI